MPQPMLLQIYTEDYTNSQVKLVKGRGKKWDSCVRIIEGHSMPVMSAAFSSDNTQIVSGSDDKTIRVWDATSGIQIKVCKEAQHPISVSFFVDNLGWIIRMESNYYERICWVPVSLRQYMQHAHQYWEKEAFLAVHDNSFSFTSLKLPPVLFVVS
jgi:WD40 repeat protein